jgi:hypothetical protein
MPANESEKNFFSICSKIQEFHFQFPAANVQQVAVSLSASESLRKSLSITQFLSIENMYALLLFNDRM